MSTSCHASGIDPSSATATDGNGTNAMASTSPDGSPAGPPPGTASPSRRFGRARSRRLLVTLFGDHWRPGQAPLSSAGLVRVLEDLGVTASNARAALSRLTQQGMLVRHRDGRRTSYTLSEEAWRILDRGARRIFAEEDDRDWDGSWTLVSFSLGSGDGELRRLLRARLRWMTFSPLYDGSWVTPHDRRAQAVDQLAELGIVDALVVLTRDVELLCGAEDRLRAAWDLPRLAGDYAAYLARYQELHDAAIAGEIGPTAALVRRTELVDDWRRLVRDDPDLPRELLPDPFPRAEARGLFLRTSRALSHPARKRFTELMRGETERS